MILSLTGPSGTGKSSVAHALLAPNGGRGIGNGSFIPSYTTRPQRPTDGTGEYIYCVERAFNSYVADGDFLWTAEYSGNRYGTRSIDLADACATARLKLWITILVPARMQTFLDFTEERDVRPLALFFLPAHTHEARARLRARGESEEMIQQRINNDRAWEQEARASGLPYLFIHDAETMEEKINVVRELLQHHIAG